MDYQKKPSFILGRIKSIKYALKGAFRLISTEHSIITQIIFAILMTFLGVYVNISKTEWILQILSIGLVISIEGLNTAIESLADFIHPEYHKKIGIIKDIAAGSVFFAALTAIIIGCIIYVPYFIEQ